MWMICENAWGLSVRDRKCMWCRQHHPPRHKCTSLFIVITKAIDDSKCYLSVDILMHSIMWFSCFTFRHQCCCTTVTDMRLCYKLCWSCILQWVKSLWTWIIKMSMFSKCSLHWLKSVLVLKTNQHRLLHLLNTPGSNLVTQTSPGGVWEFRDVYRIPQVVFFYLLKHLTLAIVCFSFYLHLY